MNARTAQAFIKCIKSPNGSQRYLSTAKLKPPWLTVKKNLLRIPEKVSNQTDLNNFGKISKSFCNVPNLARPSLNILSQTGPRRFLSHHHGVRPQKLVQMNPKIFWKYLQSHASPKSASGTQRILNEFINHSPSSKWVVPPAQRFYHVKPKNLLNKLRKCSHQTSHHQIQKPTYQIQYSFRNYHILHNKSFFRSKQSLISLQYRKLCSNSNNPICQLYSTIFCMLKQIKRYFNIWLWLESVGVPRCMLINFRRTLKRIYYPFLATIVPTGIAIAMGDLVAQVFQQNFQNTKNFDEFKEAVKNMKMSDINFCRTLHMGLVGALLVGPVVSKWNRFIMSRMSRSNPSALLAKTLLFDLFLTAPLVVVLLLIGYDYEALQKNVKKEGRNFITKRYKSLFKEIMVFYLATKPMVGMVSCFLLPPKQKNWVRVIYNIIFFSHLSTLTAKYGLGGEVSNKSAHGGPLCNLFYKSKCKDDGKDSKGGKNKKQGKRKGKAKPKC